MEGVVSGAIGATLSMIEGGLGVLLRDTLPAARGSLGTHPAFPGGGAGSPLVLMEGLCGEGVGDGDGDEEKDRDLGE